MHIFRYLSGKSSTMIRSCMSFFAVSKPYRRQRLAVLRYVARARRHLFSSYPFCIATRSLEISAPDNWSLISSRSFSKFTPHPHRLLQNRIFGSIVRLLSSLRPAILLQRRPRLYPLTLYHYLIQHFTLSFALSSLPLHPLRQSHHQHLSHHMHLLLPFICHVFSSHISKSSLTCVEITFGYFAILRTLFGTSNKQTRPKWNGHGHQGEWPAVLSLKPSDTW